MAIFDLFSKRMDRARGNVIDVYQYDQIPQKLRVQTQQILSEVLGDPTDHYGPEGPRVAYAHIVKTLRREYGMMYIHPIHHRTYAEELFAFLLSEGDPEKFFDAVEVALDTIDELARSFEYNHVQRASEHCDQAIEELNHRFKENGVGYEYADGQIIRIDSELIHAEVVKPTISFLNEPIYAGPREEFLNAHTHYRAGNFKEAIVECLKSFESTMKAICDKRRWKYEKGKATAKDLIAICFENGLVPTFWQNSFTHLRSLLESSVPTGRNKTSGHGQGSLPVSVDEPVVEYLMHMTASTLLFLVKAERHLP